jgi:aldehyde:ferredoxin oxidoreductase
LSILVVEPDRARVVAAEELRGLSCQDVETHLRRIHPGASIAVIGPAGENLVRYASISHDGRHAGRGGNGAVLGSKNIKAIVVRGNRRPTWAYPEELTRYARDLSRRSFGPATEKYRELGTAANLLLFNRLRALPTRNFQQGSFPHAEKLAPESLRDQRAVTRTSCRACTIGCTHMYAPGDPQGRPVRLEYENLFALGPLCEIDDPEIVVRASHRCDELGMDVISTGATIAFAMECVERGLLNEPWLRFADGEALLRAIDWIGRREGVGDLLADGSRSLAEAIGHGAGEFAPHVKGLEIPGYEPRALQTMGLGFAVGARGADHNRSNAYEHDFSHTTDRRSLTAEGVELAVESEDRAAIMDSLILCKFLRKTLDDFLADAAEMLRLVAGWEMQPEELQDGARRIVNAKRVFNQRAGWTIAEDTLPPRMLQQALGDDPEARLNEPTLRAMVQHYQRCRGWDVAGQPTASQILDLKLPLDAG